MLQETKSERQRNLLDVIAPAAVLRLAAGRVWPRICSGEYHGLVTYRASGWQSGDRLGADDIPGCVREHEPAVILIISFNSSRTRRGARSAGDHPSGRDCRPLGPCVVPESQ